jgi:hypothetical protein
VIELHQIILGSEQSIFRRRGKPFFIKAKIEKEFHDCLVSEENVVKMNPKRTCNAICISTKAEEAVSIWPSLSSSDFGTFILKATFPVRPNRFDSEYVIC